MTTCSGKEKEKLVAVTGVSLNKQSLSLAEGASESLTAMAEPEK